MCAISPVAGSAHSAAARLCVNPAMKRQVRALLQFLMSRDWLWRVARGFPIRGIVAARRVVVARRLAESFRARPVVRGGPFRGMIYPELRSAGSSLVPKLLGTYESELHPFIFSLDGVPLATIVDVGCAEGYYAVGLARRFPSATVWAYDVDAEARRLCAAMARANATGRVDVRGRCDRTQLLRLDANAVHLVVADCEGFERELFDAEVAWHLRQSYVLIELHDFVDPSISRMVPAHFSATHQVELIMSIDDWTKATRYEAPDLTISDPFEREVAFAENRPGTMRWMVAQPLAARD